MDDLIFFINRAVFSGAVLGSIYALGAVGVAYGSGLDKATTLGGSLHVFALE